MATIDFKQLGMNVLNELPRLLVNYQTQRAGQRFPIQQGVYQNPADEYSTEIEAVKEKGKQYLAQARSWLGQYPLLRMAGLYLIADGVVSVMTHRKEDMKCHIPRVIRAGIGLWLCRKED